MHPGFSHHSIYLAPLRGLTDRIFRQTFENHFGKFNYIVAPFVSTIRGKHVRHYHIRDIIPSSDDTIRLIPQIIGNDCEGFLLLCKKFAELGYTTVNWNLGCPSPLITRKKRGSGLLPYTDEIRSFLDKVIPHLTVNISVKARLGLQNGTDLERIIPYLNNYPIKELIIHPRTGVQMYSGNVDLDGFGRCYAICKHRVVYNGDIRSLSDIDHLSKRFPQISSWMIGRGIVANPLLLTHLRGERTDNPRERTRAFHDELLEANCEILPYPNVLGKMKEIWGFLGGGSQDVSAFRDVVLKTQDLEEYRRVTDTFFAHYSLDAS